MFKPLPRAGAESLGIPSRAITAMAARMEKQEVHSLMVVRHGKVAAEGWWKPYRAQDRHILYSLSKSFCATAVGLAVGERLLTLDENVISFFPDIAPSEPSENLKQMRVRDLLTMGCGHDSEPRSRLLGEAMPDMRKSFLEHDVPHKPGMHFLYNSVSTYMCSAIIQKLTGKTISEYLAPRLFEPLGIEDHPWDKDSQGIDFGGWGLHLRTEDIAKFGVLCLADGVWEGKRLLPETWVAQASAKQISNGDGGANDWAQGYGFQFWRCRNECFRGDGAFGQLCVMSPKHNLVVAATASVDDIQALLSAIWEELLPRLSAAPLPEDESASKELKDKMESLALPLAQGGGGAPSPRLSGRFQMDDNAETVLGIVQSEGAIHIETQSKEGQGSIAAGLGSWVSGGKYWDAPVAASAAWTADGKLNIKARWTLDSMGLDMQLGLEGDAIVQTAKLRGAFWGLPDKPVRGKRIG